MSNIPNNDGLKDLITAFNKIKSSYNNLLAEHHELQHNSKRYPADSADCPHVNCRFHCAQIAEVEQQLTELTAAEGSRYGFAMTA